MSEHLESSTERLIAACRSMKEWAEHVLKELETRQADFQAGRAEIDRALADLQEQRANFIKESSVNIAAETSQALDVLAERMEKLLAEGGAPKAAQTEPLPQRPVAAQSPAQSQVQRVVQGPVPAQSNPVQQPVAVIESEAPEEMPERGEEVSHMSEVSELR